MLTDDELMKQISKGQTIAFEELFLRHKVAVFGFLCRLVGDRAKAEDLSQEVWMRVIQYADHYKPNNTFKSWLMTMARNSGLNSLRKLEAELVEAEAIEQIVDEHPLSQIDHWFDHNLKIDNLKKCFDHLPEAQRVAMALQLNDDLSYEDLAVNLKTTLAAVKSLLFRARQNLEKCLGVTA